MATNQLRSVRRLLWALILVNAIGHGLVAIAYRVGSHSLEQRVEDNERRAAFRTYLRSLDKGEGTVSAQAATQVRSDERLWQLEKAGGVRRR